MTFLWGFLAGCAVAGPLSVLAACLLVMRKRADKAALESAPIDWSKCIVWGGKRYKPCASCGVDIPWGWTLRDETLGTEIHWPACPK